MIAVEFKDFTEMKAFAKELLGIGALEPTSDVQTTSAREPDQKRTAVMPKEESKRVEPPKDAPPFAEDQVSESTPICTMEDVRAKLTALNKAGKRAEVKALLTSFGVEKLSEIPEDKYEDLMGKAGEI